MARGVGVPCRTHGKGRQETRKEQYQGMEKEQQGGWAEGGLREPPLGQNTPGAAPGSTPTLSKSPGWEGPHPEWTRAVQRLSCSFYGPPHSCGTQALEVH